MNCKLLPFRLSALAAVAVLATALPAQQSDADAAQKGAAVQKGKQGPVKPVGPARTPKTRGGNAWFPVTDQDLGTYFNHEEAVGKFKFSNPKSEPVTWKHLAGSCQCSKAIICVGDRVYELTKGKAANPLVRVDQTPKGEDRTPVTRVNTSR